MAVENDTNANGDVSATNAQKTLQDITPTEAERTEKAAGKGEATVTLRQALVHLFHRYRKYSVVLGGIFVYLPIGVPWYFGNLAAYLASYFRHREQRVDDIVDPQWIFSAFFVAFSVAIIISGYAANALGTRVTIGIAIVIHSGATFISYFAIQHSMVALILTFGAVGGLGAGLAYGPPMPTVARWLPRNVGLASGVLLTGFGGGAVFYNELITIYINPDNIKANVHTARTSYFSQQEILDRIPAIFLVMGGLTLALQLIGLALIRDPQADDHIMEETLELTPVVQGGKQDSATQTSSDPTSLQDCGTSQHSVAISEPEKKPDLSPREVLKTKDFYLLWLALGLHHYGYVIKNNYYKEFGARSIDNDHLLTTIGTVSTVAVAISRLCWGAIADKAGIKVTVMLLSGLTTIFTAFWYFTIFAGPALYFFWVVAVTWLLAGAFIVFPLAAHTTFGQQHYASNYGLISTVQIVVNLVSPPVIGVLLESFNWFGVFCSIAACNLLGTVAALFLSEPKSKDV